MNFQLISDDLGYNANMQNNPYADGYRDPYAPPAFPSSGPMPGQSPTSFADFLKQNQTGPSVEEWSQQIQAEIMHKGPGEATLLLCLKALQAWPSAEILHLHFLEVLALLRPGPGIMPADLRQTLTQALNLTLPRLNSSLQAYLPWCEALTRGSDARKQWEALQSLPTQPPALLSDPLLQMCLLRACLNDSGLEILMTHLRAQLLTQLSSDSEINLSATWEIPLLFMAQQQWNNQYLWRLSEVEQAKIEDLEHQLKHRAQEAPALTLLIYALYRPLSRILSPMQDPQSGFDRAHEYANLKNRSELWARLLNLSVERPLQQQKIGEQLVSLNTPQDQDNLRYFKNLGYPHWLEVNRLNLADLVQNLKCLFPHYPWEKHFQMGMRTLIAGCGTGLDLIYQAACNPRTQITGLDLSRHSLGIAALAVQDFALQDRIKLYQADLQLPFTCPEAPFDVIECVGVMHYLQQAPQALHALLSNLKPGGLLKLGVFSKSARQSLVDLRHSIQEFHAQHSEDPLREKSQLQEQRWQLLHSNLPLHRQFLDNPEFHVFSHCNLMLAPPFEHAYTLQELKELTQTAGLELVGLEMRNPMVLQKYDQRFPDDPRRVSFKNWQQLESELPTIFAPMYTAWFRYQT